MSRGTADIMRRALQFCSQRLLQKHASVPAVAFSALSYVKCQHVITSKTKLYLNYRCFSDVGTYSKEVESVKPAVITNVPKPNSPFMEELASCTSPSDVLDLTCRIPPTFLQLSHCLSQIWSSTKKMSEEQRRMELRLMWEHAEWDRLLQRAVGGVSYLPNTHLVFALLALVNLGVGPKTRVVQTYLRAAQERINEFDDKNLSILSACLENLEEGTNVKALKQGIRILVEERLPRINNVVHLQTLMRLVGKDAPLKLKQKLESKALSLSDQFTLPNAQHMVSTMATLGFTSKPLLSICSHKISEHLSGVPFNRLLTVLVSCRELRYRDLQLLEAVSEYSATTIQVWNNKQLLLLLSSLEALSFHPSALLDSFSDRVQSDPGALTLRDLLCLLRVSSALNYQNHRLFLCLSSALELYLQKMSPVQLLRAQHSLSLMGHFPQTLLYSLLHESTMTQLRAQESRSVRGQLSVVELCLRLDRPQLPENFSIPTSVLSSSSAPSSSSVSSPSSVHSPSSSPSSPPLCPKSKLSSALRTLIEHRSGWSVKEGEFLEDHHFIDAVLTKSESISEKRQRMAVLCVTPSAFCFGTSHPRGPLALKLRHLRIMGYLPLVVPEQEFASLSEERRVQFLRELIFPNEQKI
ncbi:FAST kinase domain-containing protein 2, mitochondrial [Periophthalmus magnuspinnatus]|uniref:FAST kinase domain-containing protein 2, mitochondrial n=1 Tax=Periophthalmus magnuspinnatus TaxID=409849 RepID=UPI0024371D86|nr:FAST kinase domain-containing protein 2, mitochondrial [Periophthalmus magnuspinnatus]